MAHYMLDTDICIYIAQNQPESVRNKFDSFKIKDLCMSIITHAELLYGAQKSMHKKHAIAVLDKLTSLILPISLPKETVNHYAEIRAKLEKKGLVIGNNNLWIAAHAVASDLTLVTNNLREFSRITDLRVENWI